MTFWYKLVKMLTTKLQETWEFGRFDTNCGSDIAQKFQSLQVFILRVNMQNILGEYSSFFKPSTWNYLHLNWINLYQNGFVSRERKPKHVKV